ncbi:hypothetical protein EV177_001237 [Coemansia sp. RSA 1804]|nr:hypothetical protein EV177_001237 [Coemansia sp. RSA 1804]
MQRLFASKARVAANPLARMPVLASTISAAISGGGKALVCGWKLAAFNGTCMLATNTSGSPMSLRSVRFMSSEALASKNDSGENDVENASDGNIGNKASQRSNVDEYVPVPFKSYKSIDAMTMKALTTTMGFTVASKVQDQIISRIPIKNDIIVKAKTGTGKTVAFLVSAIDSILAAYKNNPEAERKGRSVGCLIVSPTRELAQQIAVEAKKLVQFHRWDVHLLVGGESSRRQAHAIGTKRSDIVIGTPGRLIDFLSNNPEFSDIASRTKVLVLDEADMLLDMGFSQEISEISSRLPTERQTFLVSATINSKVKSLARTTFNRGFDLIDCVDKNDSNTHAHIKQEYISVEPSHHFPVLCDIIQSHMDKNKENKKGSKVVIFLPTVKSTVAYSRVLSYMLRKGMRMNDNRGWQRFGAQSGRGRDPRFGFQNPANEEVVDVSCLHGQIKQESRTRISDSFRNFSASANSSSILITTDVSARGVDYPNVSLVVQVGIPSEPEAYIHRLGRTGRAGKSGEGVALLSNVEMSFLNHEVTKSIVKNELYTPEYLESIATFNGGAVKNLASKWERLQERIDHDEMGSAVNSLIAFYEAKYKMIGDQNITDILQTAQTLLTPFGIPPPPLPRALQEMVSSRERRMEWRNSGMRRGGSNRQRSGNGFGGNSSERYGARDRGFNSNRGNGDNRSREGGEGFGNSRFGSSRFGSSRFGSSRFGNNRFRDSDMSGMREEGSKPHWMKRGKT